MMTHKHAIDGWEIIIVGPDITCASVAIDIVVMYLKLYKYHKIVLFFTQVESHCFQ